MGVHLDSETWYQCDRCTACCKWPGDVKVEDVVKNWYYLSPT